MPEGVEWGTVNLANDCAQFAAQLGAIADDFKLEKRNWTHPAARALLQQQAEQVADWAQEAVLASTTRDYDTALTAAELAHNRARAARQTLRQWWERGESWNSHRLRPVPATIAGGLQGA